MTMTWRPTVESDRHHYTADASLQLSKFQGTLIRNGERYTFTPFPEWVSLPIVHTYHFVNSIE